MEMLATDTGSDIVLYDIAGTCATHRLTIPNEVEAAGHMSFSRDGSLLAVAFDHSVGLWNTSSGVLTRTVIVGGKAFIGCVLFSSFDHSSLLVQTRSSMCDLHLDGNQTHYYSGCVDYSNPKYNYDFTKIVASKRLEITVWCVISKYVVLTFTVARSSMAAKTYIPNIRWCASPCEDTIAVMVEGSLVQIFDFDTFAHAPLYS